MNKINKHIEIVCSSIRGLSSMGRQSRGAVQALLGAHYTDVGITIINDISDLEKLVSSKPDLVFLGMKFIPLNPVLGARDPEKIWMSEYLDSCGITYTGSGQAAHKFELNKPLAKQRALDAGLQTSPYYVASRNQVINREDIILKFPVFIKPTDRGAGLGIDSESIAHTFEQLESKVLSIGRKLQSDALIEEYLPGREFSVAVLKDRLLAEYLVMPLELVAPKDKNGERYLSSHIKSADIERFLEVTDVIIKDKINTLALDVFHALGARDYGRIDIRLDMGGTPHFLEANLLPSILRGYGNFPKACLLNRGLSYERMILQITGLALDRSEVGDEFSQQILVNFGSFGIPAEVLTV